MDDEGDEAVPEERACPYCRSSDACEHQLLLVDYTFRTIEGGALYDAAKERWNAVEDQEDPNFDEGEAFDDLLEEVDRLANASREYVIEGGPGQTSQYNDYFCSSSARVKAAVKKFASNSLKYVAVEGDHCPFCHKLNAPAADDTCAHHVGWKWDGTFELSGALDSLRESWEEAGELIRSKQDEAGVRGLMRRSPKGKAIYRKIRDLAANDTTLSDLLPVVGVKEGEGWQTRGMLGGAGYNLYTKSRRIIQDAAAFCTKLCRSLEELESSPIVKAEVLPAPKAQGKRKRAVLLIVPRWPGGTMAQKFGHALRAALQVSKDDFKVVQMVPERILRVETDVSEQEFRKAMRKRDVSCPGPVHFVEM